MRPSAVLVVALASAVAACGDGEATLDSVETSNDQVTVGPTQPTTAATLATELTPPPTPPPTPAAPTEPTPPPTEPRPQVGTVLEIVPSGGDVDGQTAEGGWPILRAGIVTTEATGKIHFDVEEKVERCILRAQGQAIVVPGDGPIVRLVEGEATCKTRPEGESVTIEAGGVLVVVSDPVFRLVVDDGGLASIGVAQGAVRVGDGDVIVGGQQASYTPGEGLGSREAVEFDEDLALLGRDLPSVVFDPPAPGSSPTLDAARDRGALFVRVVEGPDATPSDLAAALLGPFGNVLGAQVAVAGTDEAPAVVAETLGREIDVMVTNAPVDGLRAELLFELEGSSWYAQAQPGDDGFAAALRAYLAGILQGPCPDGPGPVNVQAGDQVCYVDRYAIVFGRSDAPPEVPLDRFGSLLGL